MKKVTAVVIMAMLIFSIMPYAFADEGKEDNETDDSDSSIESDSSSGMHVESVNSVQTRDRKEDMKDKREDMRDALNIDRQRCLEKCRNESSQYCEARCKIADRKEDIKDFREDVRKGKSKLFRIKNAAELDLRHLSKERIETLRIKFDDAKERFDESKNKLKESRDELKDAIK